MECSTLLRKAQFYKLTQIYSLQNLSRGQEVIQKDSKLKDFLRLYSPHDISNKPFKRRNVYFAPLWGNRHLSNRL